ncbi:MAG: ABC transporter substrate-binding protein [Prochlorothrix sp.]
MRYPKFKPWSAVVLSLCMALLVACGSRQTSPNPSAGADRPSLTVLGTLTGSGNDELAAVFAPFTEATGIPVVYEATDAFDTVLPVRVEAGDPPDLALFPTISLLRDLADRQQLVPLDEVLDAAALNAAFRPDILNLGRVDDRLYGFSIRTYLKGLVWYRPEVFAAQGYGLPQTWTELDQLSAQIQGAGGMPWCIGLESGDATGWVGTDWIEALILRIGGPAVYDQWSRHEIPFTDPVVRQAFETFGRIAQDPRQTLGGAIGSISTSFMDAATPLFSEPPGCYLHYQANFIPAFFPDSITPDTAVDIFPLPAIDPAHGQPLVVADLLVGLLQDSPAGRALMQYLLTPESQEIWAAFKGHLSPHQGVDPASYPDNLSRHQIQLLQSAQALRYDGSALMPRAVDRSFASGVVDYLSGVDLDQVLATIEASWSDL